MCIHRVHVIGQSGHAQRFRRPVLRLDDLLVALHHLALEGVHQIVGGVHVRVPVPFTDLGEQAHGAFVDAAEDVGIGDGRV